MTIEGFATLEERGIVWQGIGFALIGIASLAVLSIYSESGYRAVEVYRLATTQLNWAFVVIIALIIDRGRKMFETRTEIRKAAREKAIEKARSVGRQKGHEEGHEEGREEGREEAEQRIRAGLRKNGIQLSPELENELFGNGRDV